MLLDKLGSRNLKRLTEQNLRDFKWKLHQGYLANLDMFGMIYVSSTLNLPVIWVSPTELTSAPELWLSRKPLPAPCDIGICGITSLQICEQRVCPREVWKKYYCPSLKHCFEIFTSWHEDVAMEEKAATITSDSHIWEALWAILLATYVRILHLFFWENGVLACSLFLKMPVLRKATSWLHQLPWTQYDWITETRRQIRQQSSILQCHSWLDMGLCDDWGEWQVVSDKLKTRALSVSWPTSDSWGSSTASRTPNMRSTETCAGDANLNSRKELGCWVASKSNFDTQPHTCSVK